MFLNLRIACDSLVGRCRSRGAHRQATGQNRASREAVFLEVGTRNLDDETAYPDIDLKVPAGLGEFTRKNGEPYA
jgi:uncharacterized cupin superfamily protein